MWLKKGKVKFSFDRYGVQPPSELIEYLTPPIFYNSERVQQNGEVSCGHLCLFALKQLSLGNNIQAVINYLIRIIIKMPVGKFGRNGDRTTPVYTGINIANLTNSFLRRVGDNTAIGATDMNNNIIKNVADQLSNEDVATKNYVDSNPFSTAGGIVFGEIKLNVGSDLARSLGCNDLTAGKKFILLLGSDTYMLSYSSPNSGLPVSVKIKLIEV